MRLHASQHSLLLTPQVASKVRVLSLVPDAI